MSQNRIQGSFNVIMILKTLGISLMIEELLDCREEELYSMDLINSRLLFIKICALKFVNVESFDCWLTLIIIH